MCNPITKFHSPNDRRAFIKAKYPCIANCEQCGQCAMFHGHDAETAFADYIDGKRSFEDVLNEYKR
jgi:hypothetical protein